MPVAARARRRSRCRSSSTAPRTSARRCSSTVGPAPRSATARRSWPGRGPRSPTRRRSRRTRRSSCRRSSARRRSSASCSPGCCGRSRRTRCFEEPLAVEHLELVYRPIWAFEFAPAGARTGAGVVEVDALTGEAKTATSLKLQITPPRQPGRAVRHRRRHDRPARARRQHRGQARPRRDRPQRTEPPHRRRRSGGVRPHPWHRPVRDPVAPRTADLFAPGLRGLTLGLVSTITLVALESLAIGTVMPMVARELGDLALYGWVYSAFYLGNLIGIVLVGGVLDRMPLRGRSRWGSGCSPWACWSAGSPRRCPCSSRRASSRACGGGRADPDGLRRDRPQPAGAAPAAACSRMLSDGLGGARPIWARRSRRSSARPLGWRWVFLGLLPLLAVAGGLALRRCGTCPRR